MKATRQAFGETLLKLGETNPKIVVCDADLSKSTKSEMFGKRFQSRFFQMGIAEANMIGVGAGLASSGFIPFVCSFGAFITGRYDQIRMSVAYAGAPVRLVGTHAGVGIGDDGHSQMGLEDLSLMRGIPTMMVFQPADEIETQQIMEYLTTDREALKHPAYLRLTRQNLKPVHDASYKFVPGKLDTLVKGSKVALLATGGTVQEVVAAAEKLGGPTVVNVPSIKPFDTGGVVALAKNHSLLVTVEDHVITGGLGSAVAEALADAGVGAKLLRLGIGDQFGESGEGPELYEKFGISAARIVERVSKLL